MAKYINTTKDNVKNLNEKQTVIVETIITDGKKTRNVYLGNYKRRQDAYFEGMVASGMKASRKEQKEYRLLKLSKLLAEVSVKGYNTKTNYLITEGYNNDEVVARVKEEKLQEAAANPEEAFVEDLGQEVKKEE